MKTIAFKLEFGNQQLFWFKKKNLQKQTNSIYPNMT